MSLKGTYRKILNYVETIPVNIETIKTKVCELIEIVRKQNLYKNVRWTKEQKEYFDNFWENNYGRKISARWHKLYQGINGEFNVEYIPEYIYTTKIEPKLNKYMFAKSYSDKSLFEYLCNGTDVSIPKTICVCSDGVFRNNQRIVIKKEEAVDALSNVGEFVIKPTLGGSSGEGVGIFDARNGIDVISQKKIEEIIEEYGTDFIVQKKIEQCETLKSLYADSVNTIRITTYLCNEKICHMPIALRMGTNGAKVDNIHSGGLGVGVRDSGELLETAYQLGYGDKTKKFNEHPNTGVQFNKIVIEQMPDIIEAAYSLHGRIPHVGFISWDFTIDSEKNIVLIEANMKKAGIWFPQIIHGEGIFGENTKNMLGMIKK